MAEQKEKKLGLGFQFLASGLGGMCGWMFVHPLDLIKIRMQIDLGERRIHGYTLLKEIVKNEGLIALYSGLSAALTRQACYTTLRLGFYTALSQKIENYKKLTFFDRMIIGLVSGGAAAFLSCPIEVCLVRMQADGAEKDLGYRRNYKHVFDALNRISKEEGYLTFWKGASPTVTRAMTVGVTQVATYDVAKNFYVEKNIFSPNSFNLIFFSSFTSGFIYSTLSLPFDVIKTRMQNQHSLFDKRYYSISQSARYMIKSEGFLSLWKGYFPYLLRSGGHTIMMFIFLEHFRNLFLKYS
eukprot:TRINITY_DN1246_c1_g5_i1.p1 TRINITY_DN1246_c1_g5~~TRINITY_DN1246_c1_g5_i1.p1  ORF type:complete len:297 (-),score=115.27 TRINITY_DN1246_c1_g5_i1:145-1035(-)